MSKREISRRTFVAGTVAAGIGSKTAVAKKLLSKDSRPDIVSAEGNDSLNNLKTALAELGGIGALVKPGNKVNLLVNTIGRYPGSYTSHELITGLAKMCKEAGASDVRFTDWRDQRRLRENKMINLDQDENLIYEFVETDDESKWQKIEIPAGKALTGVRVFKNLWEADVFIAMPVIKHHGGAGFSGALKMMMGVTNRLDNRNLFHGSGKLEECVAELNTACRRADLYIIDAMKSLTTGGPVGPGRTVTNNKIILGFDPVALDTYASPLIGVDPARSVQVTLAYKLNVGEMDLSKLTIKELKV